MKRKGFTLVELLAVIVILAVIALIATPMIIGVIEGTKKGAIKDSAYGLMEAADIYYANNIANVGKEKKEFLFEDGKQIGEKQLEYKGRIEKGSMYLYSDGKQALCISDGKYVAVKNVDEEEVKVTTGRCSYNEATESYETVGLCQDLQNEIDRLTKENQKKIEEIENKYKAEKKQLIKDYEEQKKTIENTYKEQIEALNNRISELEKNHQTSIDQLLADYEAQIKTQQETYEAQITTLNNQLNTFKNGGNATAGQILTGKTAYVKGSLITGTMANRGAVTSTLNAGKSYTIPAGYHDGKGKVTANSLASQTSGTATSSDIMEGKTAWVNGAKVTGTMANRGAVTYGNRVSNSGVTTNITVNNVESATFLVKKSNETSCSVSFNNVSATVEGVEVTVAGNASYSLVTRGTSGAEFCNSYLILIK